MRISSALLESRALAGMQSQQAGYQDAYSKLVSNQKITNPSDDPYGAAHLVSMDNELSKSEQYSSTRLEMNDQLKQQESVLSGVTDALHSARNLVVQALNGTLTDKDRDTLAQSLRGVYETMSSAASSRDGSGNYIFSGYKSDKPPFSINESTLTITPAANGSDYQGGGRISYRVDGSRDVPGPATADTVFKTKEGDNLFDLIKHAINALETPTGDGKTTAADIQSSLSSDLKKIDSGLDNVLSVRAEGGTRMNELDALDTQWSNDKVNLQSDINQLGNIDFTEAASDFSYRQVGYEASIRAFAMLNETSLMDFMK